MRPGDDDLGAWRDDPLVAALTAPGSPDELSGESAALAMFRSNGPRRLRVLRRLGTSGTALTIALLGSGGVAAAYTNSLPGPLQNAVHSVFSGIGVPPAPRPSRDAGGAVRIHAGHHPGTTAPVTPPPDDASPAGPVLIAETPHPTPVGHFPRSRPPARATAVDPAVATTSPGGPGTVAVARRTGQSQPSSPPATTTSPTDPTSPPASTSPPQSSPPAKPAPMFVEATANRTRVPFGDFVLLHAVVLDASGNPIAAHRVVAIERVPGDGPEQIAVLHSNAAGKVHLAVSDLTHDAGFVFRAGAVRSTPIHVVVKPAMSATVTSGSSTSTITITTDGGVAGDTVLVSRRLDGRRHRLGKATLDGNGDATFTVPTHERAVVYRLVLLPTREHAGAITRITVPAG